MKAFTVRVRLKERTFLIEPGIKLEKVQPPTVKMGWREHGDPAAVNLEQLGLKPVVEGRTVTSFEGEEWVVLWVVGMGSGSVTSRAMASNITHAERRMNIGWDGAGASASFFLVKLDEGRSLAIDWRTIFQISPCTRSVIRYSGGEITVSWS